jgi:hypothetical protein
MSSMFAQPGASSNARSIVPLVMELAPLPIGASGLAIELARHGQEDRSRAVIAGAFGQFTAMISVAAQLTRVGVHLI